MEEGDDLYSDLYDDVGGSLQLPKACFNEFDARHEEFLKQEAELQGKVEALQKENEMLQQGKAVLVRNISCLFKTAQMELARKDKQMKELRDENMRLKLAGTRTHSSFTNTGRTDSNSFASNTGGLRKNFHVQAKTTLVENYRTPNNLQANMSQHPDVAMNSQQREPQIETLHDENHKGTLNVATEDKVQTLHKQPVELPPNDQTLDSRHQSLELSWGPHYGSHVEIQSGSSRQQAASEYYRDNGRDQGADIRRDLERGQGRLEDAQDLRQINCQDVRSHESERGRPRLDGNAQNSDDGKKGMSPSRDNRSDRRRDTRLDGNTRSSDGGKQLRGMSRDRDSRSDRSRDTRRDGNTRSLDDGKRHRSPSREWDGRSSDTDGRLEERGERWSESSRRARNEHSERELSRERERDEATRQRRY